MVAVAVALLVAVPVGHDEHERVTVALPVCVTEDSVDCTRDGWTAIDEGPVIRRFHPQLPTRVEPNTFSWPKG